MNEIKVILICIVMLSACKKSDKEYLKENDKEVVFNKFPEVNEIKSSILETNNQIPYKIYKIFILDTLILIQGSLGKPIKIFRKDNLDYITSFVKIGNGPNEISIPSPASINIEEGVVGVTDYAKKKAYFYNLDSIINFSNYKPEIINLVNPFNTSILKNGYVYYSNIQSYDYSNVLIKQNVQSGELESIGNHFLIDESKIVKGQEVATLSGSYALKNNFILYNYLHGAKFMISNIKNNRNIYVSYNDKSNKSKERILPQENPFIGYFEPYLTQNNVYISYVGNPQISNDKSDLPKEIHVFNYDGEPLKRIILDREIIAFCVDEENNSIIAADPNLETLLVKYDMSE